MPDHTEEQVRGLLDMLDGDEEAQLAEVDRMLDNYPEGHPISEAAYKIAVEKGLL